MAVNRFILIAISLSTMCIMANALKCYQCGQYNDGVGSITPCLNYSEQSAPLHLKECPRSSDAYCIVSTIYVFQTILQTTPKIFAQKIVSKFVNNNSIDANSHTFLALDIFNLFFLKFKCGNVLNRDSFPFKIIISYNDPAFGHIDINTIHIRQTL